MTATSLAVVCCFVAVAAYGEGEGRRGAPLAGTLSSVGGDGEHSPPVYRPGSQAGSPLAGTLSSVGGDGEHSPPVYRPGSQAGSPLAGTLSSVGGDGEHSPPVYRPGSQAYVVSQFVKPKPPHQYWEEETAQTLVPENRNCLLCEAQDSGACRAMPSCVYCEPTVTALAERSTPCLRCSVIKNPFFKCVPGEKYMDECDSCRCTDGHGGRCTNQYCEFRALHLYALKLSDGEFY